MGNYHTPIRYHPAKIFAKPIPFVFLQPTSKPWIIFSPLWSPFSLSSSCPQFKLKRGLVPTLQPETRRSGFQNTSNPPLATKSDGGEWPWRPLRKKKEIKESGSLQGKSRGNYQLNSIGGGTRVGAPAELQPWGRAVMPRTMGRQPEQCWWGTSASTSPHTTVPQHDLMSGSNLGDRVFCRWTKPTLCTGFFLLAVKWGGGRETWAVS